MVQEVLERVGLPITVGVARTKFLAKVASGVAKPNGLLIVAPGRELAFLHPLPVERLWGVGPVTAAKLHLHGIATVGEVARLAEVPDLARYDASTATVTTTPIGKLLVRNVCMLFDRYLDDAVAGAPRFSPTI